MLLWCQFDTARGLSKPTAYLNTHYDITIVEIDSFGVNRQCFMSCYAMKRIYYGAFAYNLVCVCMVINTTSGAEIVSCCHGNSTTSYGLSYHFFWRRHCAIGREQRANLGIEITNIQRGWGQSSLVD